MPPSYTKHITASHLPQVRLHIDPGDIGRNINLGEKVDHDCAIAFFDLCKFTSISFTLSTDQVLKIIQELFKYISERVELFNGLIDKFPGDGVVAFFPSLATDKGHYVDRSIQCASVVMDWFYSSFTPKHKLPKPEQSLELAIGIDAGLTSIAHVGTPVHSELILLGNQVNCASKCQQAASAKELLIGEEANKRKQLSAVYGLTEGPDIGVPGYRSFKVNWEWLMEKLPNLSKKK